MPRAIKTTNNILKRFLVSKSNQNLDAPKIKQAEEINKYSKLNLELAANK